jgi:hypothetical protein
MTISRNKKLILMFALAVSCGSSAFAWFAFPEGDASLPQPAPRLAPPALPRMPSRTLASNFDAIARRPLFAQTRKPSPPPEAAPQPVPAKPEVPTIPLAATLIGIVMSPDLRSAVLRMPNGKNITVAEGDSVDGWKLSEVLPDAARFKNVAATVELSFPVSPPSANSTRSSALPAVPVRRRW